MNVSIVIFVFMGSVGILRVFFSVCVIRVIECLGLEIIVKILMNVWRIRVFVREEIVLILWGFMIVFV